MKRPGLADLLEASAARHPERLAVLDPVRDLSVDYAELARLAEHVRERLVARGVRPGDRVGVTGKSIGVVAAVLGTLKAGAAYVPVDAGAPPGRSASIWADCDVRAIVATPEQAAAIGGALGLAGSPEPLPGLSAHGPELVLLDGPGEGSPPPEERDPPLAYVLYTSGSTGKPKGVVHTHASALAFVDWCSEELRPTPLDRFSSHAPFHFDLSILDLYVPLKHGAGLVLIDEELGKQPVPLASTIAERGITSWYSTPSILRLLVDYGKLERLEFPSLRNVVFAGEVFPVQHLRRLQHAWPGKRYYNLYGPTETNVCTYYEVPEGFPEERSEPFPIGRACSGDRTRVLDDEGADVPPGADGELCVAGPSVMVGYWNLPERTAASFFERDGERWYRTGDVVRQDSAGDHVFLGRRDRMIKRRGYRIEPGEIEAALYRHPAVAEAAVLGAAGDEGATIEAFLACRGGERPTLVQLKRWCADNLPMYMIPDRFTFLDALPKTSTDKIDYRSLERPARWTSS